MRPRLRIRIALAAALCASLVAGACAAPPPGDRARAPTALRAAEPTPASGFSRRSFYLRMRDGVKIAVDLYLPDGARAGSNLPTILHQTRYWRSAELRWPFRLFLDEPSALATSFLDHGYAWVSVDARGSGASFGRRPYPWSADETRDGAEIVDWIVAQPWSSGRVGSLGTSYDGTTAEFLVVNDHPAVKAAAPRFSLFDVYTDIAFPGGIPLAWFTRNWGAFNRDLDRDTVPSALGFWPARVLIAGVRPVDGPDGRALLGEAVRDHAANWDVHASAQAITYRDDANADGVTLDVFSPHRQQQRLRASGAAFYCYSGWFDGAYARAAIHRYLALGNPENRLILGPWDHGGAHQVRGGHSTPTQFDHAAELLRFFDYHLRGSDTGIDRDPPVRYFTMVEERWKTAERWPPPAQTLRLYFAADGALGEAAPDAGERFDTRKVDPDQTTGSGSRWHSLMGLPVDYPDRAAADSRLVTYTGAPLSRAVEVTGHPLLTLYVASSADDGEFFAYLEDVAPDGRVTYVTEGLLRALHRRLAPPRGAFDALVPPHSFTRAAGRPLVPGRVAVLEFDLLPTSYLFERDHAIRISLAGADRDQFPPISADGAPTWQVHRDRAHPSHVDLPVIPRAPAPPLARQASAGG